MSTSKTCVDIVEQHAIFDGEPAFSLPLAAVINLLNWHSDGGTPNDFAEAAKYMQNPKRYKVTLRLDCEELPKPPSFDDSLPFMGDV
jgi:hypothetical protein